MNSSKAFAPDRYLFNTVFFAVLLPVISICTESHIKVIFIDPGLIGKWFIFWAAGVRPFFAGIKLVYRRWTAPAGFFYREMKENFLMIRQLGFAHIAIGVTGMLSLVNSNWRQIAGLAAAFFFGLSAVQHFFIKPVNGKEMAIMITDIMVFTIMLLYLFFTLGYVD